MLIAYALLVVTWVAYLAIVSARPEWVLRMWGGDIANQGRTWEFLQTVSLWFLGVFKLFLWFLILIVLWLTLWARQLRKLDRQETK